MNLHALFGAALLVAGATAQVAIPAHNNVYNGFSRGFNFTAQTSFFITGLDLPPDAKQTGDTASYLVRINGATAQWSIGNSGLVATSISVVTGDVVDIIGNWSPAAAGNFTAHNSYGSNVAGAGAAPYATVIEGVPHTLNRTGWQWDIGAPGWVSTGATGAYLGPVAGQIGRVLMYTSASGGGGTLASNTLLGAGCIRQAASFYENFATSASWDLNGTAFTMIPTGTGYVVVAGGVFVPVGSVGTSVPLTLTDDSEVTVPFTVGSFPGWTAMTVCSNGYVSKAVGNGTGFTPAVATMLGASQDGFWSWHDFNPAIVGSGAVKVEESASVTTITWDGVWDFGGMSVANANTWQLQLYPSGMVVFAFQAMSGLGNGHLFGYSPGGPNFDPGSTDMSALGAGSITLAVPEVAALALAATSRPITGTNWNLTTSNIPTTGVLGVDVFGVNDPGINDLSFLGAPGCGLRASLDVMNAWFPTGTTHTYSLPIPNSPALLNFNLYTTSAVFQAPPVNAFGAITSNGIQGTIGNL
ncbi:MAG: hypothetical protein FJ148_27740 [Deltaproteobacteria bacterium]|nr:hypothetical protein [Deltaproteobacteria bacterium]